MTEKFYFDDQEKIQKKLLEAGIYVLATPEEIEIAKQKAASWNGEMTEEIWKEGLLIQERLEKGLPVTVYPNLPEFQTSVKRSTKN